MLSHTRMGVPYEYTHMGRPIHVYGPIYAYGVEQYQLNIAMWIVVNTSNCAIYAHT